MGKLRVYVDASVFGGYFDDEFAAGTKPFFEAILAGRATALISDTLVDELRSAPDQVRALLHRVMARPYEHLPVRPETLALRNAYLRAGVLAPKWADDALHVAHAVTARADVIVSWNFKHLVNPRRIRGFSGVDVAEGFGPVVIMTPADVAGGLEDGNDETEA